MKKQIEGLISSCQEWQKNYAKLEDKSPYQKAYSKYYKLIKLCTAYLADLEHKKTFEIQEIRKEHHKWMDVFKNKAFLDATQPVDTIKNAFNTLNTLSKRMHAIDWTALNSAKLDLQYQKEVDTWKASCRNWLMTNSNSNDVLKIEALDLVEDFLQAYRKAKATSPGVMHV